MSYKKTIKNKTIPLWVVPLRWLYRASKKIVARGNSLKEIERGGIRYLVWSGEDIGKKLLILRSFEANETAFFKKNIKPGDVCLDVGGNVGYFALNFAKSCLPEGSVYVFEPIERNVLVIKLAAITNGFENIEVIESAVSDCKGEVSLEVPEDDSAYAYLSTAGAKGEKKVSCVTIDDFVGERKLKKVSVLKVDVEGAEHLVMLGAKALLSNKKARPVVVMAELVGEFLERFGSSINAVVKYMDSVGYKPFYASAGGELVPFTKEHEDSIFNVFFVCG